MCCVWISHIFFHITCICSVQFCIWNFPIDCIKSFTKTKRLIVRIFRCERYFCYFFSSRNVSRVRVLVFAYLRYVCVHKCRGKSWTITNKAEEPRGNNCSDHFCSAISKSYLSLSARGNGFHRASNLREREQASAL